MKSLSDIYSLIEYENIALEEVYFKSSNIEVIYFKVSEMNPIIGIHKNLLTDTRKYISVLAEELGHHFTSSGNLTSECITYSDKLNRSKQEKRARIWASNFLISDNEIIGAILQNINTIYGLSLHFNVTEEIIKYKLLSIYLKEDKFRISKLMIIEDEIIYNSCSV
ncbi:ImmA/IrrE family metallo-endopeptidase [Clostridium perfringens]|uniref:ImmA/IrrE family metallo-endopeptidase n=1 Tax=Clostridium perfringens TaxID=1502 RepID=UPI000D714754|nr:ImmA/IrrE family metallo-endopeptidase [Clostridium perfringens]EGT0691116.1 ImmA/IrrE family metallo-endopeptidase [Clostridium perfringens]EGT4142288.1 ImmA/IrrE family metallo-endopeptidase [Clostridium perfringens]EJT6167372.1 ImmA/IrrE family metallo-endopeptidase [Clostridium perfringens]EJT6620724.1 ImmA/IrrE family metallo-endopeptidase [Clostridium perfringens]ELC8409599.1 ImmA/IrrE family metallo-endopeptidase [Clostridium perfringens]